MLLEINRETVLKKNLTLANKKRKKNLITFNNAMDHAYLSERS